MRRFALKTPQGQIRLAWIALIVIMLIYTLFIGYQAVLRYETFKATGFDLGNMDQAVWNTLHGRLFQFTNQGIDWYGPPIRLAQHVEPILLLVSLLYAFHADPRILLDFQTVALVSGALPVFLLARRYLPTWPLLAPTLALAYLVSPAMLGMNLFDFHPVALATPLLLYAILALTYQRYGWFILTCILAAACKEDVPLAIAMLGILVIWKYKLPRLGTVLIIGGLAWSAIAFMVVIPHFSPDSLHNNYWYRYQSLGSTPGAAIINILLRPWLIFTLLITLDRVYYLASLFRTSGFFSLLAPEWLLPALPSLAINLLSTYSPYYSGIFHYNATIIPFVTISAIHGTHKLLAHWQQWREEGDTSQDLERSLFAYSSTAKHDLTTEKYSPWLASSGGKLFQSAQHIFSSLDGGRITLMHTISTYPLIQRSTTLVQPGLSYWKERRAIQQQRFTARMQDLARTISLSQLQILLCLWFLMMSILNIWIILPPMKIFWTFHTAGSREQHIQQLLDMIPPDASVSAGANLNPHLSERRYITVFPQITFISSEKGVNTTVEYVIVDLYNVYPDDQLTTTNLLNQLVTSKQFRILARAEGVILLIRRN